MGGVGDTRGVGMSSGVQSPLDGGAGEGQVSDPREVSPGFV